MSIATTSWDDALDAVELGLDRAESLARAGTLDDLVDVLGTRPEVGSPFPARLASRAQAALERTRALEEVVLAGLEVTTRALGADHLRAPAGAPVRHTPAYVDARA
ncbi:hypothetical protein [Phycicoccus avicenniae]|uniref:hypothetical protein n=1 Tax=Phycicoccus avicenniae TaxID=2828860 RepID=UPI003D2D8E70